MSLAANLLAGLAVLILAVTLFLSVTGQWTGFAAWVGFKTKESILVFKSVLVTLAIGTVIVAPIILMQKRTERELRRAETRYRTLAETSPVGIWQTTAEGYTLYINPAMCLFFEVDDPAEMEGKTYRDFYTPESVERVQREHARRLAGVASVYEVQVVGRRGTRRDLIISGAPIFGADGSVQSFIATLVDVTAMNRTYEELRRSQREIQLLNETLERRVQERTAALLESTEQMEAFCYSISHDLRGPLRAMQGFATALVEDFGQNFDQTGNEYANRIIEASRRMDRLIQDLLEYSRLGRMRLQLTSVDLNEVISDALAQTDQEIQQRRAVIEVCRPLPNVIGHGAVLRQVVINLLTNSLKFIDNGSAPRVLIVAKDCGSRVRLIVRDNGIGIAPDHQERIFGVFERLHTADDYPGTGIGLAIVRKALERMGGFVGVESEIGKGSSFWIELPKAG